MSVLYRLGKLYIMKTPLFQKRIPFLFSTSSPLNNPHAIGVVVMPDICFLLTFFITFGLMLLSHLFKTNTPITVYEEKRGKRLHPFINLPLFTCHIFLAENQFLNPVSAETFWKRKSMGDIMCSGEVCQLS